MTAPTPAPRRQHQAQRQVQRHLRRARPGRDLRLRDDAGVGRVDALLGARLLVAVQIALVERARGVRVRCNSFSRTMARLLAAEHALGAAEAAARSRRRAGATPAPWPEVGDDRAGSRPGSGCRCPPAGAWPSASPGGVRRSGPAGRRAGADLGTLLAAAVWITG